MVEEDQDNLFAGTVGDRLRIAREEKGLSLEDVARQTRIPIRHLEHIERGEWEAMPAITYSVGFARSYATAVGVDGAEIGAEVRELLGATRNANPATAAYYEAADPARVPPRSMAIIALVIAALLVAGYLFWRSRAVDDDSPAEVAIAESETSAPAPAGPAPDAQPAAPTPATGPVVLTATEDVWLRIDQAGGGSALFMGILKAGERYEVPSTAQAPRIRTARAHVLRVTVGNTAVPPLGPPETTISNVSLAPADLVARTQGGGGAPPPTQAPQPTP